MIPIGVDCTFSENGRLQVRRVQLDGRWIRVEQGRQWVDSQGRHVLIMLPGRETHELCLRADTLTWEKRPVGSQRVQIV